MRTLTFHVLGCGAGILLAVCPALSAEIDTSLSAVFSDSGPCCGDSQLTAGLAQPEILDESGLLRLGEESLKTGDGRTALNAFEGVLELNDRNNEARFGKALAEYQLGWTERGISDYLRALSVAGWPIRGMAIAGVIHERAGKIATAKGFYRMGSSKCQSASWPLPVFQFLDKSFSEEELLKAAVPGVAEYQEDVDFFRGYGALLSGDRGKARELFTKTVESSKNLEFIALSHAELRGLAD